MCVCARARARACVRECVHARACAFLLEACVLTDLPYAPWECARRRDEEVKLSAPNLSPTDINQRRHRDSALSPLHCLVQIGGRGRKQHKVLYIPRDRLNLRDIYLTTDSLKEHKSICNDDDEQALSGPLR